VHFSVFVITENGTDAEVDKLLMQYFGKNWDWWQIGGRWTGILDGYDPDTDPKNIEVCSLCRGTGTRRDMVVRDRDQVRIKRNGGCNGCGGKGKHPVWPTERKPHDGDRAKISDIGDLTDRQIPSTIVTPDGAWHAYECWDGDNWIKTPEWHQKVRELILAHPDSILVVVDCHD
jgi:hypothetical protein